MLISPAYAQAGGAPLPFADTLVECLVRQINHVKVRLVEHGLGEGELLNVNVPAVSAEECGGIELTRMGKRVYQDKLLERLDPRGYPLPGFSGWYHLGISFQGGFVLGQITTALSR